MVEMYSLRLDRDSLGAPRTLSADESGGDELGSIVIDRATELARAQLRAAAELGDDQRRRTRGGPHAS